MGTLFRTVRSQLANLTLFHPLFRPRAVARALVRLPFDLPARSGRAGPPLAVNVLVTGRCDLHCELCQAAHLQGQVRDGLSAADLDRLAAELQPLGACVVFGGGEPFARDDLLELTAAVKRRHLPLAIVTNAVRLTPARAARVRKLGVDVVVVSLHGPEAVHDAVTGRAGAFRSTTGHVTALCKGPGAPRVILNVVLTPANLPYLDDLATLGRRLGVHHVRFEHLLFLTSADVDAHGTALAICDAPPALTAGLAAAPLAGRVRPGPRFAADLAPAMQALRRRHGRFVSFKPHLGPAELRDWYGPRATARRRCPFVWGAAFVDPEGWVLPCERYPGLRLGHVREEPFLSIWNGARYRALRQALRRGPPLPACARCDKL
jgi:MoaA/NifB/PqqE/SkfB family radical SAM enzyme